MFFNLSTIYTCMNIYTRAWILEVNPKELRRWLTCFFTILLILTSLLRYSSKKRLEHEMFTSLHPLQRCQNFSLATSAWHLWYYDILHFEEFFACPHPLHWYQHFSSAAVAEDLFSSIMLECQQAFAWCISCIYLSICLNTILRVYVISCCDT